MTSAYTSTRKDQQTWRETDLETWLMDNPGVPDERLLLVRRQEPVSRVVDLLFIDDKRRLVLVEIKNEKTTRLALGQALEYLGAYHDYDLADLCEDVTDVDPSRDLRADFQTLFGKKLESLSAERRVILTAPDFDVPSAVACNYLGHVLSGVTVSMLKAKRIASGFALAWHTPSSPVRARRLVGGLAQSPSGRRVFSILQGGAKPIVWWVGRIGTGGNVALPRDKSRVISRTNRRVVPVNGVKGIDVTEQGACCERVGDPAKRARLLGIVTTDSGSHTVFVRVSPGKRAKVRSVPLDLFQKSWIPTDEPVPSWAELVDVIQAAADGGAQTGASRTLAS